MADMQTPFALILHGGNARSALEAIAFARQGDFGNAGEKMKLASEEISARIVFKRI